MKHTEIGASSTPVPRATSIGSMGVPRSQSSLTEELASRKVEPGGLRVQVGTLEELVGVR